MFVASGIVAGFSTPAASYAPRLHTSRAHQPRAQATAVELDVVAATQDVLTTATGYYSPVDASKLDDDFVFRAPTIGPLNKQDYINTMTTLETYVGYPDITPNAFGFTQDPDEPLKCIFWTRATGTFTQPWNPYGKKLEALRIQPNGKTAKLPTECYSMTFTPEGKVRYLTAGYVVSKVEGNTGGFGAVPALFVNAELPKIAQLTLDANVRAVGTWIANNVDSSVAKTVSNPEDLPAWYAAVEPPPA